MTPNYTSSQKEDEAGSRARRDGLGSARAGYEGLVGFGIKVGFKRSSGDKRTRANKGQGLVSAFFTPLKLHYSSPRVGLASYHRTVQGFRFPSVHHQETLLSVVY